MVPTDDPPGRVNGLHTAHKDVGDCNVGDTIRHPGCRAAGPAGVQARPFQCVVGLYPIDADDFEKLRDSLGKLRLNDASSIRNRGPRPAGFWFPLRLSGPCCTWKSSRSADAGIRLELIATAPSVVYHIFKE